MSSKRGKFDFLTEERQQREGEDAAQPIQRESPQAAEDTSTQAVLGASPQASIERKSSGQRLRTDLMRAYKVWSAETGTPLYLLIEAAMEDYLSRKAG
jgi:hypothetical protein